LILSIFIHAKELDIVQYSVFHQSIKQHIQFEMQGYLSKYAVIPAFSKMLADFGLAENSEYRKCLRENRNQAMHKLQQRNGDKRHAERERLASYGLIIGMLLFIAQIGENLDTSNNYNWLRWKFYLLLKGDVFQARKVVQMERWFILNLGFNLSRFLGKFYSFGLGIFEMKHVIFSFLYAMKFSN
jgi:hypothetical protein